MRQSSLKTWIITVTRFIRLVVVRCGWRMLRIKCRWQGTFIGIHILDGQRTSMRPQVITCCVQGQSRSAVASVRIHFGSQAHWKATPTRRYSKIRKGRKYISLRPQVISATWSFRRKRKGKTIIPLRGQVL